MNWKSSGKLTYSPRTHLKSSENWLVVMCDDEIANYYRCLYRREFPWLSKLQRPVWGCHISVVRGENIPNVQAWGFAANRIINFDYEPGVKTNGEYFWLTVHCDELLAIREVFGVRREPKFGLHLTIGRIT
jgi:hypothetical protein